MKLHLHPYALCRTAACSYAEDLAAILPKLKAAIRESSPEFYELIREVDGLGALDAKVRHTLWKYANRIRYRATPYGRFAAVTPVVIGNSDLPAPAGTSLASRLRLGSLKFHRWPDWPLKERLLPVDVDAVETLCSNGSHYRCGNELRYLFNTGSGFEMAAVDAVPELLLLLDYCKGARLKTDVLVQLAEGFGYDETEAIEALRWLVDEQLLLTDRHPNITGQDFFARVGYVPQPEDKTYLIPAREIVIDTERRPDLVLSSIEPALMEQLVEVTTFLAGWLPATRPSAMDAFAEAFSRRFEQREVPLMEALDPELGVGYGGLEDADVSGELIATLKSARPVPAEEVKVLYGTLHHFLLNGMLVSQDARQRTPETQSWSTPVACVQLENLTAEPPVKKAILPNTLSALLRISDGMLVLDNLGGATASSLMGRFTKLGGVTEDTVKELIAMEQQANPDVLFADIAYIAENNVDNVNRRPNLYRHELPILCWSTAEQPIALNDVRVSVRRGEVILRSATLNKRIVPRLSTAYNHSRSDLSVFRFLCDLQGQGLQTQLGLRLDQLFPGLDRYPRVAYKNVLLSPAKWKLPDGMDMEQLRSWLAEMGINRPFRCGRADQMLYFDPASDADLSQLLSYPKQQKDIYLEEALLPESAIVTDERGKPLAAEWLVSLRHGERVYEGYTDQSQLVSHPTTYIPGKEWLYYEIYGHTARMDEVLLDYIAPFIDAHASWLGNWFFIRYNEGGNHLRLRLRPVGATQTQLLMAALADALHPLLESGILRDVQLKTYRPELGRYGHAGMEAVESVFGADSRYMLKWLSKRPPVALAYRETGVFFRLVMDGLGYDPARQLALAKRQAAYFATEMDADPAAFKRINAAYKIHRQETAPYPPMGTQLGSLRDAAVERYVGVVEGCPEDRQERLLTDLFHMHVNRLFADDQRMHEWVVYEYLVKDCVMAKQCQYSSIR